MKVRARLAYLRTALTGRVTASKMEARFAGGEHSRIVSHWFSELASVNDRMKWTLTTIRARSRQMAEDNGEAEGLLKDFESDLVGPLGARLNFRATRPRGAPIEDLNDRVESAWKLWGKRGTCTLAGGDSWAGLQRLAIRTVIVDGEFLAERVRDPRLPYGYALQVLDPDQLDDTLNRSSGPGQNAIVMGVEVDGNGRPVRYHLWDRHPSSAGRQRIEKDAADILHVFKKLRPGQVRGLPWFAPALVTWKLGDRYTEAELYQSLLAAAQGGFFVNANGDVYDVPKDANGQPIPLVMEAEPGSARMLPPGWTFQEWKPTHPTANYVGFMKAVKRIVARAFGRSYASLTGDLSDVNFSSMRTDRVREMAQSRLHQQDLLVEQLCEPVFADWVRMASLVGALGVVPMDASRLTAYASWMCTGWAWIDPVKDATAAQMEMNMGVTSPQRICAEKGRDFYEIVDEIAEAKAYAAEKGLHFEPIPLALAVTMQDGGETETTNTDTARGVIPLRKGAA